MKVKSEIVRMMQHLDRWAKSNQTCKRKAVGAGLVRVVPHPAPVDWVSLAHNGPANRYMIRGGHECSGEVGGCGCSHAEQRLLLNVPEVWRKVPNYLVLLCTYAPCTSCANAILNVDFIRALVYDHPTPHDPRGLEMVRTFMPVIQVEELATEKYDAEIQGWGSILPG